MTLFRPENPVVNYSMFAQNFLLTQLRNVYILAAIAALYVTMSVGWMVSRSVGWSVGLCQRVSKLNRICIECIA